MYLEDFLKINQAWKSELPIHLNDPFRNASNYGKSKFIRFYIDSLNYFFKFFLKGSISGLIREVSFNILLECKVIKISNGKLEKENKSKEFFILEYFMDSDISPQIIFQKNLVNQSNIGFLKNF